MALKSPADDRPAQPGCHVVGIHTQRSYLIDIALLVIKEEHLAEACIDEPLPEGIKMLHLAARIDLLLIETAGNPQQTHQVPSRRRSICPRGHSQGNRMLAEKVEDSWNIVVEAHHRSALIANQAVCTGNKRRGGTIDPLASAVPESEIQVKHHKPRESRWLNHL